MKISVVILNWNGVAMLRKFLPSVISCTPDAEIVVADNASTDDSISMLEQEFPSVRRILLDKNYGFAGGYNEALRQVEAEYYLLLNSDVEVTDGWLEPMLAYMDNHPDVCACQPKLRFYSNREMLEYAGACGGYMDRLGYPYCRGRIFETVEKDCGQYNTVQSVDWATGAALLIRSQFFWEVGGFDARFFAHQEEIDLCCRLRSRGYGIVCIPDSVVYHVGGGTLPKDNPRKTYLNFRNNQFLLYKNLPNGCYYAVFVCRFFLDALASLTFLLKGEGRSFLAVWKARMDFHRMKSAFSADRKMIRSSAHVNGSPFSKCIILWQYYVRHHRFFSQLPK